MAERERALGMKEQQLQEYDQRLSSLSTDVGKLEARSDQLKKEVQLLEGDAAKGAEAAAAYKTLSAMLPNLKRETESLTAQVETLRTEQAGLDGAVAKAGATLRGLEDARAGKEADTAKLERTLDARSAELEGLKTGIASNKVTLEFYTQAVKEQKARYAAQRDESSEERKQRDALVQERDEVTGELTGLQKSAKRLRAERAAATNELDVMTADLERLSTRIRAERKSLAELESDKATLTEDVGQLAAAKAEHDMLLKKKAESDRQLADVDQRLAARTVELAEHSGKADALKKQIETLEAKRLELERIVNQLIGQQHALDTKQAEHDVLLKKKADVDRQLASADQQLAARTVELAAQSGKADVLKEQIVALEEKRLELERIVNQLIGQQRALEATKAPSVNN